MAAFGIALALQDLIERHVDARTTLLADAKTGDTSLALLRADQYRGGDSIALRNNDKADLHKIHCVDEISGIPTLVLCDPVTAPFSSVDSWIQKTYNKQTVENIVVGTPDHHSSYPSITIQALGMTREPLTLGSFTDTFSYEIGVRNDATAYSDAYATVLQLTDTVQTSLYTAVSPLMEPFFSTTLTDDVTATDKAVRVEDNRLFAGAIVFIQNSKGTKRYNIVESTDNDSGLDLRFRIGSAFQSGDTLIHPLVHLYDPRIESVSYDDSSDGDHLLHRSSIIYTVKMQLARSF